MSDRARWVVVAVAVACVIGLIAWARGAEHHHGQDVGAVGATYAAAWEQVRPAEETP